MIPNVHQLQAAWNSQSAGLGLRAPIEVETQLATHTPHGLPAGKCAVYLFSLASDPGCVLKVGKAGPQSNARFQSHHYGVDRAPSTLARRLVEATELWSELGFDALYANIPGRWIRRNTDRVNFYLDASAQHALEELEKMLLARLNPLFEGRRPWTARQLLQRSANGS
jgi:hypothetical protein